MASKIEPNSDFIEEWLSMRKVEAELDTGILLLIDRHRRGTILDESDLLKSLLSPMAQPEENDGPD